MKIDCRGTLSRGEVCRDDADCAEVLRRSAITAAAALDAGHRRIGTGDAEVRAD